MQVGGVITLQPSGTPSNCAAAVVPQHALEQHMRVLQPRTQTACQNLWNEVTWRLTLASLLDMLSRTRLILWSCCCFASAAAISDAAWGPLPITSTCMYVYHPAVVARIVVATVAACATAPPPAAVAAVA